MRKTLLIIISIAGIIVSAAYRSGAPTGTTCAPGETNCSTSGLCHSNVISTLPGMADITIMGGVPSCGYVPGQTYTLMPYLVSNDGKTILGFETVVKTQNGDPAGSVGIIDPLKTQKYVASGFEYVTHTRTGSSNPGIHDWMYDWTAPPVGSGPVTIYAAFLAANGDGTSTGDLVYTHSLVLTECPTGVNEIDENNISVYPNPAVSELWIMGHGLGVRGEIMIYNVFGDKVKGLKHQTSSPLGEEAGGEAIDISLLPRGIYFVVITQGERRIVKQFCKI